MRTAAKKIITLAAISAICTGCTTVNPYTGQKQVSRTTVGAGVGAAGGAIIGGIVGGGRGALIGAAVGGVGGAVVGSSIDREQAELGARLRGTGVQVRRVGNSVKLIMYSDVTFAFGSANVKRSFYPVLNSVSDVLRKYENTNIVIAGYTDNVGNAAYNQRLSERRAQSVGNILTNNGVSSNRIFTKGYGKRNPLASNRNERSRSRNRRVEITLRPMG